MAIAVPSNEVNSPTLKQRLARAERLNRWKAQALIAPLVLFLLLVFLVPIVALLYKSVGNPEVVGGLPRTVVAVKAWDGRGLPGEPVYQALSEDLGEARKNQTLGDLSKRLNMELAGYRLPKRRPLIKKRWKPSTNVGATRRTGRRSAAIPAA